MKKMNLISVFIKIRLLYLLPLIIQGCQTGWYPEVDFGSSVNKAINDQIVNKNSPNIKSSESMGMDGPSAKATIDNYQKSFEQSSGTSTYGGSSGAFINPTGSSNASSLPSITGR